MWKAYKQIKNPPKRISWEYVETVEMLPEENFEAMDIITDERIDEVKNINNLKDLMSETLRNLKNSNKNKLE